MADRVAQWPAVHEQRGQSRLRKKSSLAVLTQSGQSRLRKKSSLAALTQSGQNTVEYLLMLTVVVGVVLVAGMALKRFVPGFFEEISRMISGAAYGHVDHQRTGGIAP